MDIIKGSGRRREITYQVPVAPEPDCAAGSLGRNFDSAACWLRRAGRQEKSWLMKGLATAATWFRTGSAMAMAEATMGCCGRWQRGLGLR